MATGSEIERDLTHSGQHLRAAWRAVLPDTVRTRLLQACLLDAEAAADAWDQFEKLSGGARSYFEQDFGGLKGMLPYVAYGLEQNQVAASSGFMTYARVALVREGLRSRIYYEILAEVIRLLPSVGVDYMLLKGAAIGRWLYPTPDVRHNHAIDLLIAASDVAKVQRALAGAGFTPSTHAHEFTHNSGLPVRLHTELVRHPCQSASRDCCRELVSRDLDRDHSRANAFSPALLLHQTLGNAAFSDSNRNLRWVVDAVLLIRHTTIDWKRVIELGRDAGLWEFYLEVLAYLFENFDVALPSGLSARTHGARHPHRYRILLASLLTVLGSHRRVWHTLGHSAALRLRFSVYAVLPPVDYLRWRYGLESAYQILAWHAWRPFRIVLRLAGAPVAGARAA